MSLFEKVFHPISLRRSVRDLLKDQFSRYLDPSKVLYDIGCGDKPFAKFLEGRVKQHIGVDIESGFYDQKYVDLFGSAYEVPVEDGVADVVLSSQVLEHLDRPIDAIKEASRLLKPGGLMLLSCPFLYPVHAKPHDYLRYTEFYLKDVLQAHDLEIIEHKKVGGFWICLGVFTELYLNPFNRSILRPLRVIPFVRWVFQSFFMAMHLAEGAALRALGKTPERFRNDWSVNHVLVAKKKGG